MALLDISPEITRVLDLERTLENLGHDTELLREILGFFVEMAPGQIDDLAAAVTAGEVEAVNLQAHGLKGGASNVGAIRVVAVARELEMLAKGGELQGAQELMDQLRCDFEEFQAAMPRLDWSLLD